MLSFEVWGAGQLVIFPGKELDLVELGMSSPLWGPSGILIGCKAWRVPFHVVHPSWPKPLHHLLQDGTRCCQGESTHAAW